MKISSIEAVTLEVDFATHFGGAERVPEEYARPGASFHVVPRSGQYSTLVYVTTDTGLVGVGECWGLPVASLCRTIIETFLSRIYLWENPQDVEGLWERAFQACDRLGYDGGVFMEALSGIDIALWDILGRASGEPLAVLLGGQLGEAVACYAGSVRYHREVEASAQAARDYVEEGFRAIKVKVGRELGQDVATVAAIREAVGEEVALLLDANCGYERETAVKFAQQVDGFGLHWLEEPVRRGDWEGLAKVRKNSPIPLAVGENEFTAEAFERILREGRVDIVMPNITRCGGVTGFCRIAAVAKAAGAKVSLHGVGGAVMLAASLHALGAIPGAELFEYNRFLNPLRDDLLIEPIRFHDGALETPRGAGLGVELRQEMVERHATSPLQRAMGMAL